MKLQVLLGTLGVMGHVLEPLPPHLSLPVCVTYFWMNNCKPKPSHPLLQAILLGMVYGELSWRSGHPNGITDPFFTQHLSQMCGLRRRKKYLHTFYEVIVTSVILMQINFTCLST